MIQTEILLRMRRGLAHTLWCLALAACGGDGEGDDGGSQIQRAIEPAAQERAESFSDFPDGWRAGTPDEEDNEDEEAF
jgi:hypothetical protein